MSSREKHIDARIRLKRALEERGWTAHHGGSYEYVTHPSGVVRVRFKPRATELQMRDPYFRYAWKPYYSLGQTLSLTADDVVRAAESMPIDRVLKSYESHRSGGKKKKTRKPLPVPSKKGAVVIAHTFDEGTYIEGDTKPIKDHIKSLPGSPNWRWFGKKRRWYIRGSRNKKNSPIDLESAAKQLREKTGWEVEVKGRPEVGRSTTQDTRAQKTLEVLDVIFSDDIDRPFKSIMPTLPVGIPVLARKHKVGSKRTEWREWNQTTWPSDPKNGETYDEREFREAIWDVRNTDVALALDEWSERWKNSIISLAGGRAHVAESLFSAIFDGAIPSSFIEHALSNKLIDPISGLSQSHVKRTKRTLENAWVKYVIPEVKRVATKMMYLSDATVWDEASDEQDVFSYLSDRVGDELARIVIKAREPKRLDEDVSKELEESWKSRVFRDVHSACLRIADDRLNLTLKNFERFLDGYFLRWSTAPKGHWILSIVDATDHGYRLDVEGTEKGKTSALETLCGMAAAHASPIVKEMVSSDKKKARKRKAKWRTAKRRTPELDKSARAALSRAKKRGDEVEIAAVNAYLLLPKDEKKYASIERSRERKAKERKRIYRPRLPSGTRYRVLRDGKDCEVIGRLVKVASCKQGDAIAGKIENGECLIPTRGTIYDERNRRYEYEVEVLPPEKIRASHDTNFRPVEGYPQEFQARDRGSKESQLDITQMANHFDPERFSQVGPTPVEGAPVVWGKSRDVLAGNGRMLAFLLARPSVQEKYYDLVEDLTGKRGVLVRRLVNASKDEAINFAAASQRSASAPESPIERAVAAVRSLGIKRLEEIPPGFFFDDRPRLLRADNVTDFEIDNRSFVKIVYPHGAPALASDRAERYREVLLGLLPSAAHETIQAGGEKVEEAFTGLAPYLAQLHGMRVFREDEEFKRAYDPVPRLERAAKLMRRFKGKSRNAIYEQLTEDLVNRHMFVDEGNPIFSMEAADLGWVYGMLGSVGLKNPELKGAEIGSKLYEFVRKEANRLGSTGETAAFFDVEPPDPLEQVEAVFGKRIGDQTRRFAKNLEDLGIGDATRKLVERNPILLLGNPTSRWQPIPSIFLPGIEWRKDGSNVKYRGTYTVNTLFFGPVDVDVSGTVKASGSENDIAAAIGKDINEWIDEHPEVLERSKATKKQGSSKEHKKKRKRSSPGKDDDIYQRTLFDMPGEQIGLFNNPLEDVIAPSGRRFRRKAIESAEYWQEIAEMWKSMGETTIASDIEEKVRDIKRRDEVAHSVSSRGDVAEFNSPRGLVYIHHTTRSDAPIGNPYQVTLIDSDGPVEHFYAEDFERGIKRAWDRYGKLYPLRVLSGVKKRNPRQTCLDCVRKHLAQAEVLMSEARQGYPDHAWLAVGHLGEAAEEALEKYPELASEIRKHRLRYMADTTYDVPTLELISKCKDADERKALDTVRCFAVASNPRKHPDDGGWPDGAIPIEDLPEKVRKDPSFKAAQDAMIARYGTAPTFAIPVDAPRGASPVLASIGELKRIDYVAADAEGEPVTYWYHEAGDRGEGKKPARPQIVTYDPQDDKILLVNPPGAKATFTDKGIVG